MPNHRMDERLRPWSIRGGSPSYCQVINAVLPVLNTAKLAKGNHRIEAKAFAANLSSETASVDFTVNNPEPAVSSGGNPWCLPAVMVAVVAGMAGLILFRKKKAAMNG